MCLLAGEQGAASAAATAGCETAVGGYGGGDGDGTAAGGQM